jgi:formylglycine-generating enzyme required for sulfatase activity
VREYESVDMPRQVFPLSAYKLNERGSTMKVKRIVYGCVGALIFIALGLLLCSCASAQTQHKPGDVWKDPVLGTEFVWVPGGCYEMGCGSWARESECNNATKAERPVHTVCVSGFWMGKYEVTQGQWQRLMGDNPSYFKNCGDNCPVEAISWNKAVEFAKRLSEKTGYTFRLPTESEWEYACRSGGRPERYCGGDKLDAVAWYNDNSGDRTHPVGQKRSNGLGIYDMSGNVEEWCQDWYDKDYYGRSPRDNPDGPSSGTYRILRGGSWSDFPRRVFTGGRDNPDGRYAYFGLRLVRVGNE